MKKLFKEFAEFINKGNALALAIGVIIGGAFTAIVTAINEQIITPLLGWAFGGFNLSEAGLVTQLTPEGVDEAGEVIPAIVINWGSFIQAVINFLLTAIVLFTIFKIVSMVRETARRAAEKLHEQILKADEEEVIKVVEEVPAVVEEPVPSAEVVLLTEIRDLLSKKENE